VQRIGDRFESLNPYNRKLVPGSILKVHKLNWDRDGKRRQLYGYSIAAKRYALYTKTQDGIQIVEPKAHGLGYFHPPKDSPEGWGHETPQWIFEAWDWILRGALGLKRTQPAWFDLPVMMRLTLSTPHHAQEPGEGTSHASVQFHDVATNMPLRMPGECRSQQVHADN
jgi:hypothetical protein